MSSDELLQAQLELYHHGLAFVKSLALKAATDLRIPDAIHRRGGAATLSELASDTGIHPTKRSNLRRVMRVLTTTGVFSIVQGKGSNDHAGDGAASYKLTRVSRLLVERSPHNLSPMHSLVQLANGCTFWDTTKVDGGLFNDGMAADSRIAMKVLLKEHGGAFGEVKSSLVDIGGNHGATASAVARAFPHLKCSVLDLPHVVAAAPASDILTFVAGNMFEYVPPADAVLLKWILHDWKHEDCVKIMRRCKEAIPAKEAGGKVIIIDMVVGYPVTQPNHSKEAQVLLDIYMMGSDGMEREENEWSLIFSEAGFSDYKITRTNGIRSIIEVYP
ncbi:hypothetical protein CFC21_009583 [Triticum aestivum]|uniref:acetylserotonin O-methyltransferase n=1 Tax=Triticum aestivum TaxID=4565 RepID=A0A9R1DJG6_WHEAT|nr:hypothetical protein CFC21_009583 [Triticum aestivum]